MPGFSNLKNILNMNFAAMRALPADGGMRATDEAITSFVDNLNEFFAKFNIAPTQKQLQKSQHYMQQILEKINNSELEYYRQKYTIEYGLSKAGMAESCLLNNVEKIPERMQFWAAAEKFGGTIRNADQHKKAVEGFQVWASFFKANREEPTQTKLDLDACKKRLEF